MEFKLIITYANAKFDPKANFDPIAEWQCSHSPRLDDVLNCIRVGLRHHTKGKPRKIYLAPDLRYVCLFQHVQLLAGN